MNPSKVKYKNDVQFMSPIVLYFMQSTISTKCYIFLFTQLVINAIISLVLITIDMEPNLIIVFIYEMLKWADIALNTRIKFYWIGGTPFNLSLNQKLLKLDSAEQNKLWPNLCNISYISLESQGFEEVNGYSISFKVIE